MRAIVFALSLVLIFILPWEGAVNIPGLGTEGSSTLTRLLGLGVGALWLLTVVFTGRFRKPGLFHMVLLLFVLWNAASVFWSVDPDNTFAYVGTWAQLFMLTLILWDLFDTKVAILAGLQAYVLGAYIALGSAVSNFLGGNAYYTHYERYSAGDTNPDGFGFILALGIPVAWYLASSESTTKWGKLFKVINYAYIPAAFLGIALSGTRTAMIAAIPGMAFGLASITRLSLWAKVTIFLFLASAALLLQPYVQPLKSFQRLGTTSAEITEGDLNNRTNNWREGMDSFEEHPLFGVGGNMYRSINSLGKVAHSSYLSILVELGLIGFALFGTILAIAVVHAWGLPKWDSIFWLTILLVWAIGASTLTWEYRKTTWLFLSLLFATAALIGPRVESVARLRRSEPVSRAVPYAKRNRLPRGEFDPITGAFLKGKAR